jgi:hypothetical protein
MDREHAKVAAEKGKGATTDTAGKVGRDKKLQKAKENPTSAGLPENSSLKIAKEQKKRWQTATRGT